MSDPDPDDFTEEEHEFLMKQVQGLALTYGLSALVSHVMCAVAVFSKDDKERAKHFTNIATLALTAGAKDK